MADPHDFAIQAQSKKNLRGGRKQGDNSHEEGHSSIFPEICNQVNVVGKNSVPKGRLFIEKILPADLVKGLKRVRPTGNDFV